MNTEAPMSLTPVKTILVVDDDPSTMVICVKKSRAEGFTVLNPCLSKPHLYPV